MKIISLISSFFYFPYYYIYTFFLEHFLTKIVLKKISTTNKSQYKLNYKFESPILEINEAEKDYKKIISPSLQVKQENNENIFAFAEFMALDDRFCSFKENLNFDDRKNKILIIKTKKDFLPGHILKHNLTEKTKNDKRFECVDLGRTNIKDLNDLYSQYKFIVVIENCDHDYYTSEKYYDVIKSGAIPVYHKLVDNNFKHCHVSFENLEDPNILYEEVIKFSEHHNYKNVASQNFKSLKNLRFNLIFNYLKYSVLPMYAFSELTFKKSIFYKIKKFIN